VSTRGKGKRRIAQNTLLAFFEVKELHFPRFPGTVAEEWEKGPASLLNEREKRTLDPQPNGEGSSQGKELLREGRSPGTLSAAILTSWRVPLYRGRQKRLLQWGKNGLAVSRREGGLLK